MTTTRVKDNFRIHNQEGLIMYTGTDKGSWFTLEEAKKLVNRKYGETIHEYTKDYMYEMWEVL